MRGGSRLRFCVYSILFFLYLHTLTVLKWTDWVGMDWEEGTESNKATEPYKDREIIIYSDADFLRTTHKFLLALHKNKQQKILQLDADMQRKQQGRKRGNKTRQRLKETVKRERAGWQCVGGSLLSSFGEAFCWQQDRHLSSSPSPPISSQSVDLTDTSLNNTSSLVCDYPSHNFPSSSFLLLFISTFRSSLFVSSFPFFIFTSFCVVSHPPFFLSIFHYFFLFLSISFFPIFYFTFQPALPLFDSKSLLLFIPSFYGFLSVPFHPFDPFFLTYRTQYAAFSLQSVCET